MLSKAELLTAIDELEDAPPTFQNCQKMATFYTLLNSVYGGQRLEQSFADQKPEEVIKEYGNSEFLQAITGKKAAFVWQVINETMDALEVLQPKLYDAVIRQLSQ